MRFLVENWSLLVVVAAVFALVVIYTEKFVKLPNEAQIAKIKEFLLYAVIMAEKELGSGTGALKLRYVWSMFIRTYPALERFVSFEDFSKWVDEVLVEMRHLLETNLDVRSFVEGE